MKLRHPSLHLLFWSAPYLSVCFQQPSSTPRLARSSLARMSSSSTARNTRVAYIHGFASSSESAKGVALRNHMKTLELDDLVDTPDVNRPSFSKLTVSGALQVMDELHEKHGRPKWNLVGSSMGGHLCALWAARNPDSVDKLVLLCPAFDLPNLWPAILGDEKFKKWEDEGELPFKDGFGEWQNVHFGFVEDARKHEQWPTVPSTIPTLVIHGEQDEVIPIASSLSLPKRWTEHKSLEVEVVQDDHGLYKSTPHIMERIESFFDLRAAAYLRVA